MPVGKVSVAHGRSVPPVLEHLADQRQVRTRHDRVTGGSMLQMALLQKSA